MKRPKHTFRRGDRVRWIGSPSDWDHAHFVGRLHYVEAAWFEIVSSTIGEREYVRVLGEKIGFPRGTIPSHLFRLVYRPEVLPPLNGKLPRKSAR